MENDLVGTVKFCFTGKVISRLSQFVDEPEPAIEKCLTIALPLVLNQLVRQTEHGMAPAALLDLVRDADAAEVLAQLSAPQNTTLYQRGADLLLDMLGASYRDTVTRISVDAGIRPSASATLLQVANTAALGVLGKFATENDLTPAEFIHWLQSQKDTIGAALLPTANATLQTPPAPAVQRQPAATPPRIASKPVRMVAPRAEPDYRPTAPQGGGFRWQWALLLLLAVSLGYFFGRDFIARPPQPAAVASASPPVVAVTAEGPSETVPTPSAATVGRYDIDRDTYVYDTGRPIVLTLANGSTQKVGANSTENRLYVFLATAAVQVDSVNRTKGWINFDRVYFEPNAATLKPQSLPQLRNIANILRTFPTAVVKIGGYTDSVGVTMHNLALSEDRARMAMLALAKLGVSIDRLQSKGYGANYFVAPNSTPANRALNRRVSLRVVKK
jgi:OOP family OmpA-OmpF porin